MASHLLITQPLQLIVMIIILILMLLSLPIITLLLLNRLYCPLSDLSARCVAIWDPTPARAVAPDFVVSIVMKVIKKLDV